MNQKDYAKIINPASPYTQQGDCLVKRCGTVGIFKDKNFDAIPGNAVPTGNNLILKGENNSHALYEGKFEVLSADGQIFIRVHEDCILDHVKDIVTNTRAQHHAQLLPKGEWFVDSVKEMDHIKNEARALID